MTSSVEATVRGTSAGATVHEACVHEACAPDVRTSAHALLGVLAANGVDRVFLVPGESYLGVLDALSDFPEIDVVTCRHEAGAGFMAVTDGRLARRPGVVLVSRGPGATNASIAVHTAQQDAVPLILIVGQIPKRDLRREAFQEIDYQQMFGSIAKWVFEVTDPAQVAEAAFRAVRVATTGTPGPVVLVLPEDIQQQPVACPAWQAHPHAPALPASDTVDALHVRLRAAQRPLIVAGGMFDVPGGREVLQRLAEHWQCPVVVSFRRQDLFPNAHPLYAGDLGLANPKAQLDALRRSDLILALGTRHGDISSQGFMFPDLPVPAQTLVHCYPDPGVVGRHFAADFGLVCDAPALARALTAGPPAAPRPEWCGALRALYEGIAAWPVRTPSDGIDFNDVVHALHRHAPDDLIVTVDAGTFAVPVYRHVAWRPPQLLMAPLAGAMGYGVPAAIAAQLRHPHRRVVCLVGDGGFMMTGNEMIAAVERRLPILFVLSNNASYASIRIHQEREYPGRHRGTSLFNPDFTALAAAFGMHSRRLDDAAAVDATMAELMALNAPAFIEVTTSLQAVLPAR